MTTNPVVCKITATYGWNHGSSCGSAAATSTTYAATFWVPFNTCVTDAKTKSHKITACATTSSTIAYYTTLACTGTAVTNVAVTTANITTTCFADFATQTTGAGVSWKASAVVKTTPITCTTCTTCATCPAATAAKTCAKGSVALGVAAAAAATAATVSMI